MLKCQLVSDSVIGSETAQQHRLLESSMADIKPAGGSFKEAVKRV